MRRSILYPFLLWAGILINFAGVAMRVMHWPFGMETVIAGQVMIYAFAVMSLMEVHSYPNLATRDKVLWTVFFVITPVITGIIYFFARRKVRAEE
jgi:hypothetical protein